MKRHYLIPFILLLLSACASVQSDLPMETEEELAQSALIILGNPPGTYPVTNDDIPRLLEFSRNSNPAVRHMSVYQLGQLDTTVYLGDILPLLVDEDKSVARNTRDLYLKNQKVALEVFHSNLILDNKELTLYILDFIGETGDRGSLPYVLELFLSEDQDIIDKAVSVAARLADASDKILYESLLRPEAAMRKGIVRTFSLMGDPSVLGTLLPYFYDPDTGVQNAVKFAFIDFGKESIPYLVNVLNNPAPQTQLAVLGLLEALSDPDAIEPVIELFDNENKRVRERAAFTVSTFGDQAVEALGKSLESDRYGVVLTSIDLLGDIGGRESLLFLMTLLDNIDREIRDKAFEKILLFGTDAGDLLLRILDRREEDLYYSAVSGLMRLADRRLISDNRTSLFNMTNRNRALITKSTIEKLRTYLNDLSISGLLERDYIHIKEIYDAAALLIHAEREIEDSGSRYTTFYISRNEFLQKSDEALKLSFSYMHTYMDSRDPEDLEVAKKQQEFSEMFKNAAADLTNQLESYIGTTDREIELIESFEKSRENIISLYESVSINRKNLADDLLRDYGLSYERIVSGEF